ncbi:unnamed protein product [Rotaria magnacalcarata]|uniref:Dymeclin n=3 Tax=Rotaria magnacalcarata TaxID=392030 RepID=A0A819DQK3_9BILA|nr:unnamed protein product [Rotaria magnacalcarata]CAF2077372.1 unnamed protein product [Rotaria magnacalcarata]CAF3835165.1 unnamed protein product [Rotaria magnacalcarata]CAF3856806.1 unnamed protein product [Rotaria magnacalcarata]
MGAQYSSLNELKSNQYLSQFVSEEIISVNDPFWNQFLSFRLQSPFTTAHSKLIDESCSIFLQQFEANNPKTNNYGTLIEVFIRLATAVRDECDDNIVTWQTYSALFILRCVSKYFIEIDSEQNLYPYFLPQDNPDRVSLMSYFVDTLFRTTIAIPVQSYSYALHLEVLNTLLSLLSIQMCAKDAALINAIYSIFMHRLDPLLISEFTRTLLEHFIKQTECPSTLAVAPLSGSDGDSGTLYKIGQSVAYGLWSVVTLGMGSSSTSNTTDETVTADDPAYELRNRHLANQSIHLLLILSNHFTNDAHRNPYRLALLHFTDTQGNPTNLPDSEPLPWFSVDYRRLYDILCETAHTDQSTLLLYMLLHRNQHFKAYVISRTNIDQIVLPVLRVVYAATERNSHHIYMSLIILLILSEDDYFNKTIHDIKLKKLSWYTERSLNEISLGGLLVAVVLRTIQFNMTRMRDKYLHTNCLAALANMSSQFQNLHTYVSQRIVSLFNLLARKHTKTLDLIKQQTSTTDESLSNEYAQDLSIIEDVMRMVLEIINSCLTHTLQHNINLIYTLLYNRDIFDNYRTHPNFEDILQNIDIVIVYFADKVDKLEQRSTEYVKEALEMGAKQFPLDRLKKFPELKFKYVEEEQPEDFFVPYVWTLVYKSCNLYWSSESILIFKQQPSLISQ